MGQPANINTTVVNTSGQRMYFDFLPPTGLYLEANQEFSYPDRSPAGSAPVAPAPFATRW